MTVGIATALIPADSTLERIGFHRPGREALRKLQKNTIEIRSAFIKEHQFSNPQETIEEIYRDLTGILHFTVSILQTAVDAPCAATIKLLINNPARPKLPRVHTFVRDPRSKRDRGDYRPRDDFPFTENTAFQELLTKPRLRGLWGANGLGILFIVNKYENSNERWEEFYDSTVVLTISAPRRLNGVIGFLCIDSSHRLDVKKVGRMLAPISGEVYNKLQLLFLAQAQIEGVGFAALQNNGRLGWDCSTGDPAILESGHQSILERAATNTERAAAMEMTPAGARERSTGGERSRAAEVPPEWGAAMVSGKKLEEIQGRLRNIKDVESDKIPEYVDSAGRGLYRKLQRRLATKENSGKFVRINVATGEYVVGDRLLDALDQFETRFGDAPSWGTRIV